jgi:hypothetical protein
LIDITLKVEREQGFSEVIGIIEGFPKGGSLEGRNQGKSEAHGTGEPIVD